MADYINVLNRAASLDSAPAFEPYTGVRLWYDDEHYYFAGNESGRVMEADQPWATEAMANSILSSISGFRYQPFEAGSALLDMEAELGDGVNVGGVYSLLASVNTTFGAMTSSDLSAPSEEEVDNEYPYKPKQQRELERSFRRVYSEIAKTDEEIRLSVFGPDSQLSQLSVTVGEISASVSGLGDQYSELALTVDGFTVTDQSGTTRIKGSSIETETLYVDAAHISGKLTADQIQADDLRVNAANIEGTLTANQVQLTGSISWSDLGSDVQSEINNAGGISSSQARTLITNTLVSSPTIAGGRFYDIRQEAYITMEASNGAGHRYGDLQFYQGSSCVFNIHSDNTLSDFDPDAGGSVRVTLNTLAGPLLAAVSQYNGEFWSNAIKPQGTWDFEDANVTGLTHTYVPVWG